ncbi:MAG: prolyl oligopeptidase family serine peptidase [Chthoniobacteraceae bacterium]
MRLPCLFALLAPTLLFAQATPTAKQAPPPGIAVPEADAAELKAGVDALGKTIAGLRGISNITPEKAALLPDVEVLHKAVRYALEYGEFFNPKEIAAAKALLALGTERTKDWQFGPAPWTTATGPTVLGYRSRIDGSAQPYGLIVPDDWKPGDKSPRPLYLWFHGRGDTLSEVNFISSRLKGKRDFATANAFELHLYGRYCNASKFAGETDAFEAIEDVKKRYAIDENRIAAMGFSMGGATAWHIGAHYAGTWATVSSGAGFAETAIYAKVYDEGKVPPPWWEEVLYHLYNATDVAANYANVPLVAYSGELDPQIQSGKIMNEAMEREGLKMEWLIGPGVPHKYEPETKKELSRRIDAYMANGREPLAPHVHLTTYTLRYNQMKWITVDALQKHWERADIDAQLVDEGTIRVKTKNVAAFTINFPAGPVPLDKTQAPRVIVDEQEVKGPAVTMPWKAHFAKVDGEWWSFDPNATFQIPEKRTDRTTSSQAEKRTTVPLSLSKRHGLQGPIDDAFMDSFIFVRPTGKPLNDKIGAWAKSELERAIVEWRKVFRGDARVVDDTALTPDQIANANLILWGDPASNAVLAKVLPNIPLGWDKDQLDFGRYRLDPARYAPIMIFPNPLNPQRYIVLNTGFTFRMGAKTSNSLQTPKLPDWALIDLQTPPDDNWPGQVMDAGFFDERWQVPVR